MANQQAYRVDIDPDGDVVFICTYGDSSTLRLRVSSKVVSLASPVFKAMLSPHFREGATLATASYVEIGLPEDDAQTMQTMLLVMHAKHDRLSSEVNLQGLVKIVDKYDCVIAVAAAAHYWISKAMEDTDQAGLENLLHDAYVLRQHELFATIARRLVLHSKRPIQGEQGVLTNVYPALESERKKSLLDLSTAVQDHILAVSNLKKKHLFYSCQVTCNYQAYYALAAVRRLDELKLWPITTPGTSSVLEIIERMSKADSSGLASSVASTCGPSSVGQYVKAQGDKTAKFSDNAENIKRNVKDVCLCCVQEGWVLKADDCCHTTENPFMSNRS